MFKQDCFWNIPFHIFGNWRDNRIFLFVGLPATIYFPVMKRGYLIKIAQQA
jgi:hypothetical protein